MHRPLCFRGLSTFDFSGQSENACNHSISAHHPAPGLVQPLMMVSHHSFPLTRPGQKKSPSNLLLAFHSLAQNSKWLPVIFPCRWAVEPLREQVYKRLGIRQACSAPYHSLPPNPVPHSDCLPCGSHRLSQRPVDGFSMLESRVLGQECLQSAVLPLSLP